MAGVVRALQPGSSLHLLNDFMQTQSGGARRSKQHVLSTCDCMPFEDFEKGEKNYRMQVSELSENCCLLVNPDSRFLLNTVNPHHSGFSLDLSKIQAFGSFETSGICENAHEQLRDLLTAETGSTHSGDDPEPQSLHDASLDDDGFDGIEPMCLAGAVEGEVQPPDPWAQFIGDPYDTSQNVNQPHLAGCHERRVQLGVIPHLSLEFLDSHPDSVYENGCLLSARVLTNACVCTHKPIYLGGFEDMHKDEQRRRKQELRLKSERLRDEDQKLHRFVPSDVDPTAGLHFDDGMLDLDEANDAGGFDDDFADQSLADGSIAGLDTPTQDKWVEEAVQQMSQYNAFSEAEAAVHERVSEWTRKIRPILDTQEREESERPFKIYDYADGVLQSFAEAKAKQLEFAKVVSVADALIADRGIHVARSFLACLQLANHGSVRLEHPVGLATDAAPLTLKLLDGSKSRLANFDAEYAGGHSPERTPLQPLHPNPPVAASPPAAPGGEPPAKRARRTRTG